MTKTQTRTKNTKRNVVFSFLDSSIMIVFKFLTRSLVVQTFSSEYLGLSSLITSILQVLNMADLGFSSAIIFNLYKPLAENDTERVCALLKYYKSIYRKVGIIICCGGVVALPIIPHLITNGYPEGININVIFFIYLANTVSSYFLFAYKTALLDALQRLDLTKIAYSIANIIEYGLKIITLVVLKNYYAYVLTYVLGTVFKNLFCAYISKRKFPEYDCHGTISDSTKKDIKVRVKGLLIGNISSVTYTTFDSIILSSLIGLSTVAIYNNYIVVFSAVMSFVVLFRGAMQSSVGNSLVLESKEKNYQDMLLWQFLFSTIATICVTIMLNLYQPFMAVWMGKNMLLELIDVILLCVWFFISVVSHSFYLYLSGNGLWWEIRWPYICSTICNIVLNLILGKLLGVTGIILSTVISTLIFASFWQCLILFTKYYKNGKGKDYFFKQIIYSTICILSCIISYCINNSIEMSGLEGLLIRIVISIIISTGIIILLCRHMPVYKKAKSFLINAIHT